ncbi:chaplin [Streptomyces sp. NPDC001388]|uniref:chaplin n=1 Tax=unclassified Streptomyces TaxID=2593676 RepID=UPI0036C7E7B3
MIRKAAVIAAAAGGLVLADAGWAVADSGEQSGSPQVVCALAQEAVMGACGNTYVFAPDILGSVLNLFTPPPGPPGPPPSPSV